MDRTDTSADSVGTARAQGADSAGSYEIEGHTVTMPVQVRRARQAAATFVVPFGTAQRLVEHTGLRASRRGRFSIASLAVVEYLDNDLGTYDELALAVVVDDPTVAKPPRGVVSTYIHRLPVSEHFTCVAGRGIWGFPKWEADLDVTVGTDAHGALLGPDGTILDVTVRRGPIRLPRRALDMVSFTFDEGVLRRTEWRSEGDGPTFARPGGCTVTVGYGHPIADEVRSLGLPKRALMSIVDPAMRASFSAPTVVVT
ncbi:MAG: acetoacetate decarboxylase family protein [Microthrixaceae bacterium]